MVVAHKVLAGVLLSCWCCMLWAQSPGMLAKRQLAERVSELEIQQDKCKLLEAELPESLLKDVDLSVEVVQNTFLYRYFSHQQSCIREALGNYYIALASAAIFYPDEISLETGDFNFASRRALLESQVVYEELSVDQKAVVDKWVALDKPFTMESAVRLLDEYSR